MKKINYLIFIFLLLIPTLVRANDNFSLKCYDSAGKAAEILSKGDTITCNLSINSSTKFKKVSGNYTKTDNLELVEIMSNDNWTLDKKAGNFTYTNKDDGVTKADLAVLKFKVTSAISNAKLNVSVSNIKLDDKDANGSDSYSMSIKTCLNGLSTLTVDNVNLSPEFDSDTLNYKGTTKNGEIKISAKALCDTSSISGIGTKSLEEGENVLKVVSNGADGSSKIYTLTITYEKEKTKDKDNTLSSLKIKEADIDFDKDTLEYDIDIEEKVDKLTITYKTTSDKASVKVEGNEDLVEGENVIKIIVTAEDGSEKEYIINATIAKIDGSLLKNLKITDNKKKEIKLAPTFKEKTKTYTIKVPSSLETLNIEAICKDDKCEVTGDGEVSIKGKDKIEITVKHGDNETTYKINIKREVETAEKSSHLWLIILIIILILLTGGGITFFIIKKKKNKKPKPKKIITKHETQDTEVEPITKEIDSDSILDDSIIKDNLDNRN